MDEEKIYKEMYDYDMNRRKEKLEKWIERGWTINKKTIIKYEMNQMIYEDWCNKYLVDA
mgnify:CR=1 FL=1